MELNDLKCPSCGAEVKLPKKTTYSVFCQYCGSKLRLDFTGHTVHLFDDAKLAEIEYKNKLLDISDDDLSLFKKSKTIWMILFIAVGVIYTAAKLLLRCNMDEEPSSAFAFMYYANDAFLIISLILLTIFRPKAPKNIKGVKSVSPTVVLTIVPIIFIMDIITAVIASMVIKGLT